MPDNRTNWYHEQGQPQPPSTNRPSPMTNYQSPITNYPKRRESRVIRFLKKSLVSGFVIFSFVAYALHDRAQTANSAATSLGQGSSAEQPTTTLIVTPTPSGLVTAPAQPAGPTQPPARPTQPPTQPPPTATPVPARASNGLKDGTYNGQQYDVFYGVMQVQAVIKNGKLTTVNVLQYPNDRRTSVRINQVAIPDLQQEAVQAQSANVDFISGATLTSEGFAQSLQDALSAAKS